MQCGVVLVQRSAVQDNTVPYTTDLQSMAYIYGQCSTKYNTGHAAVFLVQHSTTKFSTAQQSTAQQSTAQHSAAIQPKRGRRRELRLKPPGSELQYDFGCARACNLRMLLRLSFSWCRHASCTWLLCFCSLILACVLYVSRTRGVPFLYVCGAVLVCVWNCCSTTAGKEPLFGSWCGDRHTEVACLTLSYSRGPATTVIAE